MYVMLRALTDLGFDEDWAYFLKTLLLEPPGQNLRNNLAHGSLPDVGPSFAALALRAAALVIVLAPPQPPHLWQPPSPTALVTAEERAAARAALLTRLAVPVANPAPMPALAGLPRWQRLIARIVDEVRRASDRRRERPTP